MSNEITVKDLQVKDLLVAIDLETTGLDPYLHDMWEIAVVPFVPKINDDFKSNNVVGDYKVLPCTFKARMRPQNPMSMQSKALEIGNITKEELMAIPTNLYQVLNSFYEWKLEMYPTYRFVPVGHNYSSFDKQFLIAKMNSFNYDQSFSHHSLDTKIICKWLQHNGHDLGKKLSLQGLKKFFGLEEQVAHSSMGDCLTCIELLSALNNLIKKG
jgi:DNA polymerase III epsilon subunit-like protein